MPGFALAKLCAELFPSRMRAHTSGIVLLNHGLFTFGDDARSSYERTIELVTKAEDYLSKFQDVAKDDMLPVSRSSVGGRTAIAELRREVSRVAGKPMILVTHRDDTALHFAQRPDLTENRAARSGDSGPRDSDEAHSDDRARCRFVRSGLPTLLRSECGQSERRTDDA